MPVRHRFNDELRMVARLALTLTMLMGTSATALASPPVPGQIATPAQAATLLPGTTALQPAQPVYHAAPMNPNPARPAFRPALSAPLNPVMNAQIIDGELRVIAPPGAQLLVKNRFLLQNPTRMVVDLDQAELPAKSINIPAGQLGPMPYGNIRLSQFDDTTVRLVVEAQHADKLNITLGRGTNNLLRVYAPQPTNIASRFLNRMMGRAPQPRGPQIAYTSPTTQGVMSDVRPLMGPPIALPGTPLNRLRVIDIARSQLGVSKAVDRDYVNNTFSRGKDEAWCADFVSTVMNWAGGSPWGHTALVKDIYEWGVANQRLKPFPEPGDVAIFRFSVSGFDHTAIVEGLNPDNTLMTIGGNEGSSSGLALGGMVNRNKYKVEDPRILGYVTPF